ADDCVVPVAAATDKVPRAVQRPDEIIARAGVDVIVSILAAELIVSVAAEDLVIAERAVQHVVARAAMDRVVAELAGRGIIIRLPRVDDVGPGNNEIISPAAVDYVISDA